jgi:hypothetical protein
MNIAPLSGRATFESIGRLVRACADLEIVVDLYIARLCRLSELEYYTLLGRTSLSGKISIAQALAENHGEAEKIKDVFTATVTDAIDARNLVSHGPYLGLADGGLLLFATNRAVRDDGQRVGNLAQGLSHGALREYAEALSRKLPKIIETLQVAALLRTVTQAPISPHPRSRPAKSKRATRGAPPGSSRA